MTSPAAGFPSPEQAEAVAVPPHERVWLDDREDATPFKEAGGHNESHTRGVVGPSWLHLTLYVRRQLLAQEEILGGQASVGPETEGDQARDISDESENGAAHDGRAMIARINVGSCALTNSGRPHDLPACASSTRAEYLRSTPIRP